MTRWFWNRSIDTAVVTLCAVSVVVSTTALMLSLLTLSEAPKGCEP